MELVFIFASLLIACSASLFRKHRLVIESTSIIASLIGLISSITIALKVKNLGIYAPFPLFTIDSLGAILIMIITLVGFATTTYSVCYLREETAKQIIGLTRVRQYFALLNLFLCAMILGATSSSPIFTWISIEATTLATAFLISFYNKPSAMEAAWKYLIVNSIGLLLGFLGTLLFLTSLHSTGDGFATWSNLLGSVSHLDPRVAKIAFIFVLIGYGTKVGLVPMHTWLPDAHSKAPAPISSLLSGVLLNVAFFALLRFKAITDACIGSSFSRHLLIAFGLLSILVASLIIFTQRNYKRLLAYSSVENMGIAALGFGFNGLGAFFSILHVIYHSLIKSALFLAAGTIFLKYSSTKIIKVRGVITTLPYTGTLFLLGFFIITGTPPFGIFFTKLSILAAGMQKNPELSLIALVFMAILFVGFLKHISQMFFGEKPSEIKTTEKNFCLILPPLLLITITIILSFHLPNLISTLITRAIANY